MASLSQLTDKQNSLLTQLSYQSHVLINGCNGKSLEEILLITTDKEARKTVEALCNAGLGTLRIKDVANDSVSGFGAVAFVDDYGNTGFSFRGSDGAPNPDNLNDWLDNIAAGVFGTSYQTAQAEQFFDKNRDASGNNYLYGHSKGGNLAESVYVNNYSDIKEVHLLNPQPINPFSLSPNQLAAMQSDKLDIVIVEGDYVWLAGLLPTYKNIRIAKNGDGDAHTYEVGEELYDDADNIIPGKLPAWEYFACYGVSVIAPYLQLFTAGFGLVYNCVVRVVDLVKEDLIPKAKEFIAEVSDALEKFGNEAKEFANRFKEFLTDTADRAEEWFKNTLNSGYRDASANPQINVDTHQLRSYAQRLQRVNGLVSKLDERLDALYLSVGLIDRGKLMQADILTGYSRRLLRCAAYLNDVATEFESVEKELVNQL